MNCANHPETPAAAYCQFCGKALCAQCVHKINGIVGCEPCLAARVQASTAASYGVHMDDGKGFQYRATEPLPPGSAPSPASWGMEPWVAFCLGWIPGVGAMYNGQFAKGLAHVVIFALLVDLTHINGLLGLIVAGWVIYQVFDAYQTAIARRAGLPVPNPLGINNIGQWFAGRSHPPFAAPRPMNGNPATPNPGATNPSPVSAGFANFSPGPGESPPVSSFAASSMPPYGVPPVPPDQCGMPDVWHYGGRGIPTGAVVMIVLGVAFLLGNLGILSARWMDRGWPILLIALGVWLVVRRSQTPPTGGMQ